MVQNKQSSITSWKTDIVNNNNNKYNNHIQKQISGRFLQLESDVVVGPAITLFVILPRLCSDMDYVNQSPLGAERARKMQNGRPGVGQEDHLRQEGMYNADGEYIGHSEAG